MMERIAKQSVATSTFDTEMAKIESKDYAALQLADCKVLHSLGNFHLRCRLGIEKLTEVDGWQNSMAGGGDNWVPMWNIGPMGCCRESCEMIWQREYDEHGVEIAAYPMDDQPLFVRSWFREYLSDVRRGLAHGPLLHQLAPTEAIIKASMAASACAKCRQTFHTNFPVFVKEFSARAESTVRMASFTALISLNITLTKRQSFRQGYRLPTILKFLCHRHGCPSVALVISLVFLVEPT